jgi:hypothetical protein
MKRHRPAPRRAEAGPSLPEPGLPNSRLSCVGRDRAASVAMPRWKFWRSGGPGLSSSASASASSNSGRQVESCRSSCCSINRSRALTAWREIAEAGGRRGDVACGSKIGTEGRAQLLTVSCSCGDGIEEGVEEVGDQIFVSKNGREQRHIGSSGLNLGRPPSHAQADCSSGEAIKPRAAAALLVGIENSNRCPAGGLRQDRSEEI